MINLKNYTTLDGTENTDFPDNDYCKIDIAKVELENKAILFSQRFSTKQVVANWCGDSYCGSEQDFAKFYYMETYSSEIVEMQKDENITKEDRFYFDKRNELIADKTNHTMQKFVEFDQKYFIVDEFNFDHFKLKILYEKDINFENIIKFVKDNYFVKTIDFSKNVMDFETEELEWIIFYKEKLAEAKDYLEQIEQNDLL